MNGCQGTLWNEELDGKELPGAAGDDLKPRESAVSCTSSTRRQDINSTSIYKFGIMLFLGGGVSCVFFCYLTVAFLANCSTFVQTGILSGTQNYACPDPYMT